MHHQRTLCSLVLVLTLGAATTSAQFGLPTTFVGGTGGQGNMFDVVAARDVLITGFDVNVSPGTLIIEVWAVASGTTFIGKESSMGDWALIDRVNVISPGAGNETRVSLRDGIAMTAGQTLGLYVTAVTNGSVTYTVGNDFTGVASRDASLTILEGVGKSYPFGFTFGGSIGPGGPSRIWNGRVYYDVVSAPSTGFAGLVGQAGNMFDVDTSRTVQIREFDVHLGPGTHTVEIYVTRTGSFVGKEMTPSDWRLIASATVTSNGTGTPTTIPVLLDQFVGATRGFYVTTTSGLGIRYGAGSNFGGVAAFDGTMRIFEGTGNAYPFGAVIGGTTPGGTSRIWNGTIRYRLPPISSGIETFDALPGGGSATPPPGWLQDLNDASGPGSDWLFRNDSPPSLNGPVDDHTNPGLGNFAYTEDSSPSHHAAVNLLTPPIVIPNFNASLRFRVNSNDAGATQNPLAVDVIEQPSGAIHEDIVLQVGETDGTWTLITACLTPFIGKIIQVRFRGRTDGGSFDNDVGLDDVRIASVLAPVGTGQHPRPGLAELDINDAGEPVACRPVSSGAPGPYSAVSHAGGTLDVTIRSEPAVPVLFFAGQTNPDVLDLGAIGKLDVGNNDLTGIVLLADGNGSGFFDSLFRTDATGDLHFALPTPGALLGFSLGFQAITFNSSPSAISLSNAVDVTFIP